MRRTWRRSRGIRQLAARGDAEQLLVGDAAPQEERQARGQLDVAQRVHLSRRRAGRVLLHAEEEIRIDEQPFERELDAGVEAAPRLRPPVPEELEQRLDVPIRRRPAIGAAGQPREDPLGARLLLRYGGGIAHEDSAPARRVLGNRALVGAFDRQRLDLGVPVVPLVVRQDRALHHRLQRSLGLPPVPDERDPDDVRPCIDRHPDLQVGGRLADVPLPLGVARFGRRPGRRSRRARRLAPHREPLDEPAVDAEVEQVPSAHAADVVLPVGRQRDAEDVVAVGRKMVRGGKAAAGSERQVLVLPVRLRQQHRVLEAREIGRRHDTGGQARDLPRGRQIALQLRGRYRKHFGVVVEPGIRCLVPGQHRRHVDFQREEVTNRVAVLRAVQAMHRRGSARIRVRRGRLVDLRLQPARDRTRLFRAGPRASRRRHRARRESRDHPLPQLRVGARPLRVHDVQREPRLPELRIEHGRGRARRRDSALAVTADAVAIEEAAHGFGGSRRGSSSRGGQEVVGGAAGDPASRRPHGNRYGRDYGRHGPGPQ